MSSISDIPSQAELACKDLAMDILREAVVEKGYWYSSDHLDDSDLDPLRARSDFQELTRICRGREEAAKRRAHAEIELVHPQGQVPGKLPALVVALHGNQLNAATTRREWCVDSLSDCLVALPQSSHSVCADAYSWNDPIKGAHEVKDYVDGILHGNIADRDRVVLGGFSAGGRVVMHLLLKRMVRANGAILLGPWLPDLVSLEPMIPNLREDRVKVYLMCGDQDQDCYDSTNRLADLLRENGVPYIYQVFKGMGHRYPPDLDLQSARRSLSSWMETHTGLIPDEPLGDGPSGVTIINSWPPVNTHGRKERRDRRHHRGERRHRPRDSLPFFA